MTSDKWSTMTAEERKAHSAASLVKALDAVKRGDFPTGIPVYIGDAPKQIKVIARPVRMTDGGGVTYGINARPLALGRYVGSRFNKLSFTLSAGGGNAEVSFDKESFDLE